MGPVATAPPAKADFGIEDLIMDLLDPGVIAAAAEPAATLDLSTLLADLGLSGTGATDTTALAITDLPDPSAVAAAADPAALSPPPTPPHFRFERLLAVFGWLAMGQPIAPLSLTPSSRTSTSRCTRSIKTGSTINLGLKLDH